MSKNNCYIYTNTHAPSRQLMTAQKFQIRVSSFAYVQTATSPVEVISIFKDCFVKYFIYIHSTNTANENYF